MFVQLSENELQSLDGGMFAWQIAVTVAAVIIGLNEVYDAGKNLGEAIYYATH